EEANRHPVGRGCQCGELEKPCVCGTCVPLALAAGSPLTSLRLRFSMRGLLQDWLDMKTVHTPKHDLQPLRPILKGSRRLYRTSTVPAVAEDKHQAQSEPEPRTLSKDEPKAAPSTPLDPTSNSFYHLLAKEEKSSPQGADIYQYVGLE